VEYAVQLGDSNRLESQLRVSIEALAFCKEVKVKDDIRLSSMGNVSALLGDMSRYQEAEIFAREMVAEAKKLMPIRAIHATAAKRLSWALVNQQRYEEARGLAHEAVGRLCPSIPLGEATVGLMETESEALSELGRHEEALVIAEYCMKTRVAKPTRFPNGGKVPADCFFALSHLLLSVGRLNEAEENLNKVLGMLKSEGKENHPDMVSSMVALGGVYIKQGHRKEAAAMFKAAKKLVPQAYPKDHPDYIRFMEL
jgi:tetratricopeptide (TPR) repeat protein